MAGRTAQAAKRRLREHEPFCSIGGVNQTNVGHGLGGISFVSDPRTSLSWQGATHVSKGSAETVVSRSRGVGPFVCLYDWRSLGSHVSRRASPSMLKLYTVTAKATEGKMLSHGPERKSVSVP